MKPAGKLKDSEGVFTGKISIKDLERAIKGRSRDLGKILITEVKERKETEETEEEERL